MRSYSSASTVICTRSPWPPSNVPTLYGIPLAGEPYRIERAHPVAVHQIPAPRLGLPHGLQPCDRCLARREAIAEDMLTLGNRGNRNDATLERVYQLAAVRAYARPAAR